MVPKKSKKADLENKSFVFFEVGLIIALIVTLMAFEYKSKPVESGIFYGRPSGSSIDEEQMPITRQPVNQPPPPSIIEPLELIVVDNEVVLDTQMEFTNVETNPDQEYVFTDLPAGEGMVDEFVTEEAFFIVEEMPRFMGGDPNTFATWIQRNMIYPQSAVREKLGGRIFVNFAVNTKGEVEDVVILKGLSPEIDKEIIRVISSSSGMWTPGRQRGRPVKVMFNFPINFVLN